MSEVDKARLCEYTYIDVVAGKIIRCDFHATTRVRGYTEMEALQDDGSWKKEARPDNYLCDKHFDIKFRYGHIPADGIWTFKKINKPKLRVD